MRLIVGDGLGAGVEDVAATTVRAGRGLAVGLASEGGRVTVAAAMTDVTGKGGMVAMGFIGGAAAGSCASKGWAMPT